MALGVDLDEHLDEVDETVVGQDIGDDTLRRHLVGNGDIDRDARALVQVVLGRITSYNVCYTKLLRERLPYRRAGLLRGGVLRLLPESERPSAHAHRARGHEHRNNFV